MIYGYQRSDSLWRTEYAGGSVDCKLNQERITSEEYRNLLARYGLPNQCPFCSTSLDQRETDGPNWFSPPVKLCPACSYWALGGHFTSSGGGAGSWHSYLYWCSKLEVYNESNDSVPILVLREYVRRHPDRVRHIGSTNLERLVADVYRSSGLYFEVMHVGKPADGGVDVLLIQDDSNLTLVQVKQRTHGGTEPVSTVRNLLGAMYREGCLRGIVVSTADSFSWYASREAEGYIPRFGITYKIDLVDEGKLRGMIRQTDISSEPWAFGLGMLHID